MHWAAAGSLDIEPDFQLGWRSKIWTSWKASARNRVVQSTARGPVGSFNPTRKSAEKSWTFLSTFCKDTEILVVCRLLHEACEMKEQFHILLWGTEGSNLKNALFIIPCFRLRKRNSYNSTAKFRFWFVMRYKVMLYSHKGQWRWVSAWQLNSSSVSAVSSSVSRHITICLGGAQAGNSPGRMPQLYFCA
jgi:hypothetical protein